MVLFLPWHACWYILNITSQTMIDGTPPTDTRVMVVISWLNMPRMWTLQSRRVSTTLTALLANPPLSPLFTSECRLERFDFVMQHARCWIHSPCVLTLTVISLLKAFCFLLEIVSLFPGVDMSLRMSPGLMTLVDVEFTINVESDSGMSSGTSALFYLDKDVSEIISARISYRSALVNFLGRKIEIFQFYNYPCYVYFPFHYAF